MSMVLADLNNGTFYPEFKIGTLNAYTSPRDDRHKANVFNLYVSFVKTDKLGEYTNGDLTTYNVYNYTSVYDGLNVFFNVFSEGSLLVYFGTKAGGGTISPEQMFFSYSIPLVMGQTYHRVIFYPYGSNILDAEADYNFGTISGTSMGSMLIHTDNKLSNLNNWLPYDYSMLYTLPNQSSYNAYFTEDKVKHKLDNGRTIQYHKGFNFNSDINFEALGTQDYTDLQTIKNLKANMRFFPNIEEKPNLSYDVIWDNSFATPFTVPTWTGGGFNANMHLEGIQRLGSVGDII